MNVLCDIAQEVQGRTNKDGISYQYFNHKAIIPSYLHIWQIEHGGNMFLDKDKDYGSDSKTESYSTGPASEMVWTSTSTLFNLCVHAHNVMLTVHGHYVCQCVHNNSIYCTS